MFKVNKENPITTSSGVFINFEHGFLIFGKIGLHAFFYKQHQAEIGKK